MVGKWWVYNHDNRTKKQAMLWALWGTLRMGSDKHERYSWQTCALKRRHWIQLA